MVRTRIVLLALGPALVLLLVATLVASSWREATRRETLRESLREASNRAHDFHPRSNPRGPGTVNGADLLKQAAALASVTGPESTACNEATFFPLYGMNWTKPATDAALAAAARNAPALAMLARGAEEPVRYFSERIASAGSGACFPQAKFLLLAQLLEVRGRGEIQAGDLRAAFETVQLLASFSRCPPKEEPFGFAAWIALLHHQASLTERLAVNPSLDAPTARALMDSLPAQGCPDEAFLLMNREFRELQIRDLAIQVLEEGGRRWNIGPGPWQAYEWTSHDPWRATHGPGERVSWFHRRQRADPDAGEVEDLLSTWREFEEAWKLRGAESSRAESRILARLLGGDHTLAADALWASVYPRTFVLNLEGRVACLRTLLALKAGWLETGKAPSVIPNPPADPWDGSPVRWRLDPEGWVVWVVGIDGRDDDGRTGNGADDRALRCPILAPTGR